MKKYRIPVTIVETVTKTAYIVFNIEGETEEEQRENILKLEDMDREQLSECYEASIMPYSDPDKYPPNQMSSHIVHVLDAEVF